MIANNILMTSSTNLSVISFVCSKTHAEDEFVEGDDVVLPDQLVQCDDAFVDVPRPTGLTELTNEDVAKGAEVSSQLLSADTLQNLSMNKS